MKIIKRMILLLCLVMMSSLVFATGQGVHEPGIGIEDPKLKDANQGTMQRQDVTTTSQTMNKGDSQQLQNKEEVKTMMQEQIQQMEQEQTRLNDLAQKEKKSKGVFGWIWK